MSNLKYRLLTIAASVLVAIWFLVPRNEVVKYRGSDGVLHDTTERHIPLRRGLDLQGGIHLTLEVDTSRQSIPPDKISDAIDRALKTVRTRIEGFGVSESVVQKVGNDRISVEIPGYDDPARAENLVKQQAFLQFLITDKTHALDKVLGRFDQILRQQGKTVAAATPGKPVAGQAPATGTGLQNLLTGGDTAKGKGQAAVAKHDTTSVDSLGAKAGGPFESYITAGGMDGQYFVPFSAVPEIETALQLPAIKDAIPPGKTILWGTDSAQIGAQWYRALYVTDAKPIITGASINDARPSQSPTDGTVVEFTLNNEGGRRFRTETAKNIGNYMAIVLDDRVMGTPPVIQGAIGTRGQITMGGKDLSAAQDLSLVLRAGALPVPLKVAQSVVIGPRLGKDSINKGFHAGIVAIILIVLIMTIYYRFAGLLAVCGLAIYVLYTMAALAGFDAVLTLPGLAGLVLSIGIAVDANVLVFERMREELDRGKTVRTAIDEGFRHAMPAIVDSNVSTILTASVLYQWGSGPVRGFAVTLIAGVVASMVAAIFVVRTFFLLWLNRSRGAQTLSI
ncbi:MAG: protein translocase subunit SecD [Gemmatimonadota bacterium]|nr:protein translocase subunit SecD [Gemmatimonadota bacterium]MDE3173588.1 protein translocase subunit SecD [Gemmatimonadota bacterium]MDE3216019.1 protein translocase subunit SecD [Gemmatimonadota bacterium]